MKTNPSSVLTCLALCFAGLYSQTRGADLQYHFIKEIAVPGDTRWDYLSIDPESSRLYVAHGTEVSVIDTAQNAVVDTAITNTPGVHGFAIAPELQRGFASAGKANSVSIVDLPTLQTVGTVTTGENPDCVLFEPKTQEVYAFNGRSQSVTIFDATTGKVTATTRLPGKPEFAAADAKAGRVYDNIEDQNEVVILDAKSHQVAGLWPIAPGDSASGMALDAKHHHLFIGCHNHLMLMMDTRSGKVLASVPIGSGVDANAFDPKTGLAFASCGDGTVTIAKEDGDTLTTVQTLKTKPGARTMALDPVTHNIYLATAEIDTTATPSAEKHERMKFMPGSFKILVYGFGDGQ
jgi:DNA-binding beta-propeller fold protein YncE